jgi:hypothetical protein
MKTESPFSCSQRPDTEFHPVPDESIPQSHLLFLQDCFNTALTRTAMSPEYSFPSRLYVLHVPPISSANNTVACKPVAK